MRSTYSAVTFNGPITASRHSLTPETIPAHLPPNLSESPRVSSFPSTAASVSIFASSTNPFTARIHLLRLFLTSLKSPLYSSVISSGMSPALIRSTYSAVTFNGPITASRQSFTPVTIPAHLPPNLSESPRVSSFPSTAASVSILASSTNPFTARIHLLRLFLTSLKSPLYSSVISSGMSPALIRSTYSAVTLNGPITLSSVPLTPLQ